MKKTKSFGSFLIPPQNNIQRDKSLDSQSSTKKSSLANNVDNSPSRNARQHHVYATERDELSISNSSSKNSGGLRRVLSNISISMQSWSKKPSSLDESKGKKNRRNDKSKIPEKELDAKRLKRCLEDAGRVADGICAVEVRLLDRSKKGPARLIQPKGGFWCSPDFVPEDFDALARIEDSSRSDFVPADPLLPGTGLAGTLWNERHFDAKDGDKPNFVIHSPPTSRENSFVGEKTFNTLPHYHKRSSTKKIHTLTGMHSDYRKVETILEKTRKTIVNNLKTMTWRDIDSILSDPYQPTFRRLELLEEAGLSRCTGIHFQIQNVEGMVIFFTSRSFPISRLNAQDNIEYMQAATNLVGSAAALTLYRSKLSSRLDKDPLDRVGADFQKKNYLLNYLSTYATKCLGGNLQPLPPAPFDEGLLTFIGVFSTLLVLHSASGWIEQITGTAFILGPFGALMCLQFGLSMAPVGQPRNVIYGQLISTCVALLFLNLSEDFVHRYIRISLATASAIALMTVSGCTHPPAGASALLISSNSEFSLSLLPPVLISNFIAIFMSTLINNLSEKRQYPTFFYMGERTIANALFGCCAPEGGFEIDTDEKVVAKKASKLLREASFINLDGGLDTELRKPVAKEEALSISQGTTTSKDLPSISAVEEDIDFGFFEGEDEMAPLSTQSGFGISSMVGNIPMKNEEARPSKEVRSAEQHETTLIVDIENDQRRGKENTDNTQNFRLLSPLEEDTTPLRSNTRSPANSPKPGYSINYGSMFIMPASISEEIEQERDNDILPSNSSDLSLESLNSFGSLLSYDNKR